MAVWNTWWPFGKFLAVFGKLRQDKSGNPAPGEFSYPVNRPCR
jgi:hypothetical protein